MRFFAFLVFVGLWPLLAQGQDLTISNVAYPTTTASSPAPVLGTLTATGNVTVGFGALVTYQAGRSIQLQSGFSVVPGGRFRAEISPTTANGLPADWEMEFFGTDGVQSGSGQDPSGDGLTNAQDVAKGNDPLLYDATGAAALPTTWPNQTGGTASQLVALTSGSFAVGQSGDATYSIPVWVSPGVAGMQPGLSLNYSSNGGNGYLGVGWSLGGVPMVTRRNAAKASDGYIGPINMDSNDRFAVDGQKLLAVSGTYGADGTEYRTERETFTQYFSHGSTGSSGSFGPSWFQAKTKAGLTMEFGNPTDALSSQMLSMGTGQSGAVVAWALNQIKDVAGNTCNFSYAQNTTTGEFYVTKITYVGTSAEVDFVYEARTDAQSGYVGGAPWVRSQRLQEIDSKFNGTLVRKMVMSYEYSGNTGRSRLTQVQEFDGSGAALPPIGLTYKNETAGWSGNQPNLAPPYALSLLDLGYTTDPTTGLIASLYSVPVVAGSGFLDLNGDGILDFIARQPTWGSGYVALGTGSSWNTSFPNATSFTAPVSLGEDWTGSVGVRFEDLNGDGYPDIVVGRDFDISGEARQSVYFNTPTGWQLQPSTWNLNLNLGAQNDPDRGVRLTDLDGDGLNDVVWGRYVGTEHGALRNTGSGWGIFPTAPTGDYNFSDQLPFNFGPDNTQDSGVRIVDLNGDGLPDVAVDFGESGKPDVQYALINDQGRGWISQSNLAPPFYTAYKYENIVGSDFVDVNGDGLPDFVVYAVRGSVTTAHTWLNTGKGWVESSDYKLPLPVSDAAANGYVNLGVAFIDVNGDGLVDLVYSNAIDGTSGLPVTTTGTQVSESYNSVYLNTGHGWSTDAEAASSPWRIPGNFRLFEWDTTVANGQTYQWPGYSTGVQFIDLDGNGTVDVVQSLAVVTDLSGDSTTEQSAILNLSGKPDLLQTITASSGLKTGLAYLPITDKSQDANGNSYYTQPSRPTGSTFPVTDVRNATYVVHTVTQDDGATGGTYTLTYYYGALRNSFAEGNLGFQTMKVIDSRTNGSEVDTIFGQDYPYIGLAKDTIVRDPVSGRMVSETSVTWANNANATNSRVQFSYPGTTTVTSYEPSDTTTPQVSFLTTTTTQTCDPTWGDAVTTTKTGSDGYATTQTHARTYAPSPLFPGQVQTDTVTVTGTSPTNSTPIRTTKLDYDSSGRLQKETTEPNDDTSPKQYYEETAYGYDGYGHVNSLTISYTDPQSGNGVARQIQMTYDGTTYSGRFLTKRTDAENHVETFDSYDVGTGGLTQKSQLAFNSGQSSLVTKWTLDTLGREIGETRPDGTATTINRHWAAVPAVGTDSSQFITNVSYYIETLSDGQSPTLEFHDTLGRMLRTATITGDRQILRSDRYYNDRGMVQEETRPTTATMPSSYGTSTQYDILGRPTSISTPDGTRTYQYAGFVTTLNFPTVSIAANADGPGTPAYTRNQQTVTTRNSQGTIKNVVNSGTVNGEQAPVTSEMQYSYDGLGALQVTLDSFSNQITYTTDRLGRKTGVYDGDRGSWSYKYLPTGEMWSQTDAKSQTTTFAYDRIGRMTNRTAPGNLQTNWTYDSAPGWGNGRIATVSAPDGYSESYTYDALGRVTSLSKVLEGATSTPYVTSYAYDTWGRLGTVGFPSGFVRQNYYTGFGYLTEIRDGLTGVLYWRADSYSADGQLQADQLGNGLITDRFYQANDGRLMAIQTGPSASIQNLFYSYEPNTEGTLHKRWDQRQGVAEIFTYDELVRMTATQLSTSIASNGQGSWTTTHTTSYNVIGNILSKDGNAYTYDPTKVHAVHTAMGSTYGYDGDGNLSTINGSTALTWKPWNQPDTITVDGATLRFLYDANLQRAVQYTSSTEKVLYLGDLERTVTTTNGVTTTRDAHYIMTPSGRSVEVVWINGAPDSTRYYLTDHLGSVDTVTDANGALIAHLSYDPWGKRRLDTWQPGSPTVPPYLRRGFTDHEMLDTVGFVNMNGRIYDPNLGRFLSPDPVNQDIYTSQTYNAYSYVRNNPLSLTDPTGFADNSVDGLFQDTWQPMANDASNLLWSPTNSTASTNPNTNTSTIMNGMNGNSFNPYVSSSSDPNSAPSFGPDSARAFLNVFAPGSAVTGPGLLSNDLLESALNRIWAFLPEQLTVWDRKADADNIALATKLYIQTVAPALARDLATMDFITNVMSAGTVIYTSPLYSIPGVGISEPPAAGIAAFAGEGVRGRGRARGNWFDSLPGSGGVFVARRLTVAEMEQLTVKYNVEFSLVYRIGAGKNGGDGWYFLYSGTRSEVQVDIDKDIRWIYHTHPGGTPWASLTDQETLFLLERAGSPQRSSQLIPVGGSGPVRFKGL